MKRFGQFMLVFFSFVIISYALPIIFPKEQVVTPMSKEEQTDVTVSHTSFPYGELNVTGLAGYIDQPTEEFTKDYGEPIEIQRTALGYDWWILGENEHDYLQVAVTDNKVVSIFALGDELVNDPFEIGMKLSNISDITTIYPNFDFEKNGVNYQIELTEEDMNYRPLLAFDNGSFAILHLTQDTGKLIGVRYLNKEMLLSLMPYQLTNNGEVADKVIDEGVDWSLVNADRQRQMQSILTILRQRGKYNSYDYSKNLSESTQKALINFVTNPSKVVTSKNRLEEWQQHDNRCEFNQSFRLQSDEFNKVLEAVGMDSRNTHGILYTPSYDVPFLVMTWYSEALSQRQFTHKKDRDVGIAFDRDVVLFVFSERPVGADTTISKESEETHTTDESLE